jgi:hypothetical protein
MEVRMHRRIQLILLAGAFALAGFIAAPSRSLAQDSAAPGKIRLAEAGEKKKTGAPSSRGVTTKTVTTKTVTTKTGLPKKAFPKTGSPKTALPKTALPKKAFPKTGSPKTSFPRGTASPSTFSPKGTSPRIGSPSGRAGFRAVGARGAGRVAFHGRNYSVWRGGPYRHRSGNRWRTFVALSALTAVAVGGATYYPYAYVSAPAPVCEGETDDGCLLRWEEVPTVEGPREFQCVAYCPWQ